MTYHKEDQAISALHTKVVDSIASKYTPHIKKAVSLRDILKAIRTYVKPSEAQEKTTALNTWRKLLGSAGKGVSTEAWADSLLEAYQRGSNLGCAFTSGSDPLYDFINAALKYAP